MNEKLYPIVILAGGLAKRLRPLSENIPKSLLNINGEPFIYHQLRLLKSNRIENVVICVGHLGEKIEETVGDGKKFGLNITYSYDGPKLLGTAGAIKNALPLLRDKFFVIYGDSYLLCDFHLIQTSYEKQNKIALMTVFQNKSHWDTSNVEFSNGKILKYNKRNLRPTMEHIDYGLGVFSAKAFNDVSSDISYDLAELYKQLLEQDQLAAYEVTERFYEVGSFAGIKEITNVVC